MQELLKQIQSIYGELSNAQQQVASYVLEYYKEIPFLSVTSMAKEIGVSDTTIIKFCVQIGFNGFGAFKRKLSEYVQNEVTMYRMLESKLEEIGEGDTMDTVLAYDQNNLQATLTNPMNRQNFDRLIDQIESANCIYIIGFRTSATLAQYMALVLGQQDRIVECIVPGLGEYADKLCKVKPEDLLIAVSFPRYSTEVIQAVEMIKESGTPCALITDSPACPVYGIVDVALTCEGKSFHYGASYVSCLSLMNAVFTATSQRRKEQTTEYLKRLEAQFKRYRTFYK